MKKMIVSAIVATAVASGAVLAQTPAPKAPTAPPAATAPPATPSVTIDPAVEAKFKAIDKNSNGALDGAELTAYKADMTKIDSDKDGKISRAEFAAAMKSGIIK